jgi:hypothetical protein
MEKEKLKFKENLAKIIKEMSLSKYKISYMNSHFLMENVILAPRWVCL